MFWKRWFNRSSDARDAAVQALYAQAVTQARDPRFYSETGVPDSVDGRYDMIVLHVFLILERLTGKGDAAKETAQELFDLLFADMDQSLREMGVGDLSVGKKIKTMAQAFYGRSAAYREALRQDDEAALARALKRNVFPDSEPGAGRLEVLAAYVMREHKALAAQSLDELLAGKVVFGPAPALTGETA
ncbi:ubiquinol-cytochrome C chaperone family protein [Tepidicaulis sp. LMO-SS28]|uniref:ubiquinol-cytochrome C chaperone family protein n=1 Tax=Tepidicaulis sp. LMO-SS28 TaxID=3447455 RepID=UPI003EDF3EA1